MKTLARCASFLAFSLPILFCGCGSKPTENDGEKALAQKVLSESEARLKLVDFKKLNGQASERDKIKIYHLEYEASIEAMRDCKWLFSRSGGAVPDRFSTVPSGENTQTSQGFTWAQFSADVAQPGIALRSGERRAVKGVIVFDKAENGWRITDASSFAIVPTSEVPTAPLTSKEETKSLGLKKNLHTTIMGAAAPKPVRIDSQTCLTNLKQVLIASHEFATKRSGNMPTNWAGLSGGHKTPEFLVCPRARAAAEHPSALQKLMGQTNQMHQSKPDLYEILLPGVNSTEITKPFVWCQYHGFLAFCDGRIVENPDPQYEIFVGPTAARPAVEVVEPPRSCQQNLLAIQSAKETWALENKKTDQALPVDTDLFGALQYIKQKPICPSGGVYRLNSVGERPTCTVEGHHL